MTAEYIGLSPLFVMLFRRGGIVRVVIDDISMHAGCAEQSDNFTMLCLRYFGPG